MNRNELLNEYQAELIRIGKSDKTVDGYTRNITLFLDWMEETSGEAFNGTITPTDTKVYTSYMTTTQKAALQTINTKLSAIQSFCDFLYNAHGMTPIKIVKKKGKITPKVEILESRDLYRFLKFVDNNANLLHKAIIYTFLNSGIREEELCNLELDDIVNLNSTKGTYIIIRNGKGGKHREISISGDYKKILRDYIEHRPLTQSNKVFIGNRGTLSSNGVYKLVHRLGNQIGLHVYPHMLRHQYLTTLGKKCDTTQDLKDLSEIAGHASSETTMKFYISGSAENKRRIIDSLNYFE